MWGEEVRGPRRRFRAPRHNVDGTPVGETKAAATHSGTRAARMLALAHHIERLVEAGELEGYAEAARALGLTRARLTQVMSLLLLAPDVQERILAGELRGTERRLRGVVREPHWTEQRHNELFNGEDEHDE